MSGPRDERRGHCEATLRAVVGFGANLGDRFATLRAALRELRQVARVEKTSRVYATAPVGPPQPDFLNAAALVSYVGAAEPLLDELLAIEVRLGRVRSAGDKWGPRRIDLDLLWADGVVVESAHLRLPHPHLRERAFALVPMLEVVADATDPRTGERYVAPPGDVRSTGYDLDVGGDP
jgi:2-amino-4-hydroxy-6-hydroxymethyldihydropteridine diphosphokinase